MLWRDPVSIKQILSKDDRVGIRAILNLGHTFGHAIETYQKYTGWLHGEAVAADGNGL